MIKAASNSGICFDVFLKQSSYGENTGAIQFFLRLMAQFAPPPFHLIRVKEERDPDMSPPYLFATIIKIRIAKHLLGGSALHLQYVCTCSLVSMCYEGWTILNHTAFLLKIRLIN